jgi:hypothetical protein
MVEKAKRKDDDDIFDPDTSMSAIGGDVPHPLGALALPKVANAPNYDVLDFSGGETGAAFDASAVARALNSSCKASSGGRCLHNVADALQAGGFNLRKEIERTRPVGTCHVDLWANEAIVALQHNASKFTEIASGAGNDINLLTNTQIKVGTIAVWSGDPNAKNASKCGHIQVCSGFRADGSPIWKSDFAAKEENPTGLKNAAGMGTLHIFCQNSDGSATDDKVALNTHASKTSAGKTATPVLSA